LGGKKALLVGKHLGNVMIPKPWGENLPGKLRGEIRVGEEESGAQEQMVFGL